MDLFEINPLTSNQKKELCQLMVAFHVLKDDLALRRIFEIYDRDGDGSISEIEFRTTLKTLIPGDLIDGNISGIVRQVDTNMNGLIDFDEFESFMLKMRSF